MKTAILTVGTEILFGQIVNTNTAFLSQQLNLLGFDVLYHYSVGDNSDRLDALLDEIFDKCDLVITTGGLGPTEDDLTKEIICSHFDDTLIMNEESLNHIKDMAVKRGRALTENNYKQALLPSKATVFQNSCGSAPGFALEHEGKFIICMPGPPHEMSAMWEISALPYLKRFTNDYLYYRIIRTFGVGESRLETMLLNLIDNQSDPTIATYAKKTECSIRVASKRKTLHEARDAVDNMIEKISEVVGEFIYSLDDVDFNKVVGNKLVENDITVSVCESCTGGLIAEKLVEVSGISKVFDRGLVTYSHRAKNDELGVSLDTIEKYSAESREVAIEMVEGLYRKTGSDICVSVTGVAGPGAYGNNPAGHIFVGFSVKGESFVREIFTGKDDREYNRYYTYMCVMDEMNKIINSMLCI